jgi:tetratricopeptide (TPR) repeat protein
MRALRQLLATLPLLATVPLAACNNEPKIDPAEVEAKLRKDLTEASTRARNNKTKDAEAIWQRVLEEHPDQPEALAGIAKLRFGEGKVEEALATVDKAIAAKSDLATSHALRGEVLARLERHEDSAGAYGRAFELEPDKSEYGLPYGVQLKLAKKYPEAEKVLREVADLDPMAQFVFSELGDVLRFQNRQDEALKTYMKALRTYASDKMAHAGAAQIYEATGDVKHALDEWSTYVRMDCCSKYSETVARVKIGELQKAEAELIKNAPPTEEPPPAEAPPPTDKAG